MTSLPDDLLAEADTKARRGNMIRSADKREYDEVTPRRRPPESRAEAMRSLLSDTSPHGGRVGELVKATRPG